MMDNAHDLTFAQATQQSLNHNSGSSKLAVELGAAGPWAAVVEGGTDRYTV